MPTRCYSVPNLKAFALSINFRLLVVIYPTPQPRPTTVDITGPWCLLLALPGCLLILLADVGGLPLPRHTQSTTLCHPASRCLVSPPCARCSCFHRALCRRWAPNRYPHPSLPFVLCQTGHLNRSSSGPSMISLLLLLWNKFIFLKQWFCFV